MSTKTKETQETNGIESWFQTDNEHVNGYAFLVYKDARQKDLFNDLAVPLELWDKFITSLGIKRNEPVQELNRVLEEMEKRKFNNHQKIFLIYWVYEYFNNTAFMDDDGECTIHLKKHTELLKIELKKINSQIEKEEPEPKDLQNIIQETITKEMERFPELLANMDDGERLKLLVKLLPYVMPKQKPIESYIMDM